MLRQNGKRFYKGLYVVFKLATDLKKYTVYLTSNSPLNEGHVSILTNSMLRHIPVIRTSVYFFNKLVKFLEIFKEVSSYSYIMILWKLQKPEMLLLNYNELFSLKYPYVCK